MSARIESLKAGPRLPGEASIFWHDAQFDCDAVKVMPGEYFVDAGPLLIMTTLGSCIAACLWDRQSRVGGLNHFMLPESADHAGGTAQCGRYGAFAMELLINALLRRGATRGTLEAKVFGGGQVVQGMDSLDIGERNTRFVLDYLQAERIPVVSSDVRGVHPRKVCYLPASGKALVKRLPAARGAALAAAERSLARRPLPGSAGAIELF